MLLRKYMLFILKIIRSRQRHSEQNAELLNVKAGSVHSHQYALKISYIFNSSPPFYVPGFRN
jgi:hypothetical protein